MAFEKGKRILIHLSSSSSDDGDDDENGGCSDSVSSSSEVECESIDDEDEEDVYELDDSVEDEDEDDDESFDNSSEDIGDDNEDALYNRVAKYLQEKRDLRELSLNSYKAYLRKLGLRVSGNKDMCVKRVQEHWRIKDGDAEVLYPRSSFVINCTGDVCKGDIVLFTQKVYGSFDKVTRSGKLLGKRTVAGRVVKESYGAIKQQHTFTVEVLWSKGIRKLPPLSPLLVKGRNLYRLKTYRQPWKIEAERRKVLAEKHGRGAVARSKRAKRKRMWSRDEGPSQVSYSRKGKHAARDQRASCSKHSTTKFSYQRPAVKQGAAAQTIRATWSKRFLRHKEPMFPESRVSLLKSYDDGFHNYSEPLVGSYHESMPLGSTSAELQCVIPYHGPVMAVSQYNGFSYRPYLLDYYVRSPHRTHDPPRQFPFHGPVVVPVAGHRKNAPFSCSVHGCKESGSDKCAVRACQRCCRRKGIRCYVHR